MKNKIAIFLLALMLIIGLTSSNAQAIVYDIEKDWTLYGDLNQNLIPGIGSMACGPTAAVNSFVYLENQYPGIYDHNLVPDLNADGVYHDTDDMIAVAQTLAESGYMNMTMADGTFHDNFIYGKWKYMEEQAPGMTIYDAQDTWDWTRPPVAAPDWFEKKNPTWEFIYNQLVGCEDLEILLSFFGDGGHYLTLTSFYFDDGNNNGIIEVDEDAWVDFIDPWTGAWGQASIHDGTQWLETDYYTGGWITMAASQSPIPEPTTIFLMGSGLFGLAYRFRKKKSA